MTAGRALDIPGAGVVIPDGWSGEATAPDEWPAGRTIALIANGSLSPACETRDGERSCSAPATTLGDGDLVVWWLTTTCAAAACDPSSGRPLLVGGRAAVETSDVQACDPLQTTRQRAFVVTVSPQRVDALVVCERNPDAATLNQLDNLLQAIDWRTP
ncbi:MAG TPA: hypothetical protein VH987_05490 [Candidatus Limnocylindria bacterium]